MYLVKVIFTLMVVIFHLSLTQGRNSETLSILIKEIIENEQISSVLLAITCWSKIDDMKLIKTIPIPIQISKFTNPINLPIDESTDKQWFFIDMNCDQSDSFLLNIENKYFAHPYRWILANASQDSIQNLTFLPDSNVILANPDSSPKRYTLKQGTNLFQLICIYEEIHSESSS